MKAAIYHEPMKITTEEVPVPKVGDMDILVKVHSCWICGSDLHMYRLGLFTEGLCRNSECGMIPGHEYSGEVVEVGKSVTGIAVGDRVATLSIGGGMAEYALVGPAYPGLTVWKVPDEVGWVEAATTEPLANSLHATLLPNPKDGQNLMVFGAGIIGLGIIQCIKALNIKPNKLIMVDVSDKRLGVAKQLGADDVINAKTEDVYQRALALTGEVPVTILAGMMTTPAVDIVYDCVGYIQERPEPPVIQQALMVAREYGKVVVHGVFEAPVSLQLLPMVFKHIQVLGSYGFIISEDGDKALELMRTKKVDRSKVISHEFPIDQAKEAFDMQCQVDKSVKVMINP